MASPFSPALSFILAITVLWFKITATKTPPTAKLNSQGMALVQSGWWPQPQYTKTTLSPCHFAGITCNQFHHVIGIALTYYPNISDKFGAMDFSQFQELESLYLSNNELTGTIPLQICALSKLRILSLTRNRLSGHIPSCLGKLSKLVHLDLSINNLNGSIPSELGRLQQLQYLDLQKNFLYGYIPFSLYIESLTSLNLSYNSLSGKIPNLFLNKYSLSAFLGNKNLKYTIPPSGTSHLILRLEAIILPTVLCFYYFLLLVIWLNHRKKIEPSISNQNIINNGGAFSAWNYDGRITYEEIIKATENFDLKYCIGTGGYGSVYKAMLPNGKVVALKKLHRLEVEDFDKSFRNEVKLLTNIRHRSIIKLYGFCIHRRCMFLVYEYMERGSLFCALRNDAEALELNWSKRINIVKDIAHAMSYLHHHCSPSIVHRDLSTNNILLNNKMQAFVSDFGTARFLDPASINFSATTGTFGYIAPELAYTSILNEKSDVYSYGVIVMETIMGKHPEEIIFKLLTSSFEHIKLQEILDPRLPRPRSGLLIADILQVVSYALTCLSPTPNSRPSMKHISEAFLCKRIVAFANPINGITLGHLCSRNYNAS